MRVVPESLGVAADALRVVPDQCLWSKTGAEMSGSSRHESLTIAPPSKRPPPPPDLWSRPPGLLCQKVDVEWGSVVVWMLGLDPRAGRWGEIG